MPSDRDGRDDERGPHADADSGADRDSDADSDANRNSDADPGAHRESDSDRDAWGSPDPAPPSGPPSSPASPSDSPPPPPDDPGSFTDRLSDGWDRALDHLALAVVPVLSSLFAVDNVRRVLEFRGVHFGVAFRFPTILPDLWTFVSLPNQEPGIHVSPSLFALPVLILLRTALVAGLLGSVHEAVRTGQYDFATNVRRHFAPVLVLVALIHAAGLAALSVGAIALPLVLLLFPLFILASYLFYAAPYLLVVADLGVADALGRSYEWAVAGGPYFSYGAGYLLFVAGVSLVASALVVNLGPVGVLVGTVASAPVALALTFATTAFVADLTDERTDEFRNDEAGW